MAALNLITLEILLINLFTTHLCSRKKYSNLKTMLGLVGSILLIRTIGITINDLTGDGVAVVLRGFLFLIPLLFLYDETWDRILTVMIFSYTHTLLVNAIASLLAIRISGGSDEYLVVIIQSCILFFSTYFVVRFIRRRFITILQGVPYGMRGMVFLLEVSILAYAMWIRFYLILQLTVLASFVSIALLVCFIVSAYSLLFVIVEDSKSIHFLRKLAYSDDLTGASSRLSLYLDADKKIATGESFHLVYMDLDRFKQVNDRFGHDEGDRYLKAFAQATKETIKDQGNLYRMSGDEFVCLYHGVGLDSFVHAFEAKIEASFYHQIPFLGVSIGYARFPEDGMCTEDLITKADRTMYHMKKSKTEMTS